MNPAIQKWIETLRTHPEQSYGALRDKNALCALGVLFQAHNHLTRRGTLARLPGSGKKVRNRLQALQVLHDLEVPLAVANAVVLMNDQEKRTLIEIADWLEDRCSSL